MPYPHDHEHEVTYFARTNFRNQLVKFGIKSDDRRRHMYLVGKTGMGKSVMLENMFLSDIYAGHGCCYVDPHGDTAERLVDFIPSWRINDVVYFNPADLDHPIGFNILEAVDERHKHLVASGMMGVFKKIWENVWSARMEYILNNTILALLDNPGSTLLGINRMLSDQENRNKMVANVKDPIVKQFWLGEFASWDPKFASEAVSAIQNKIGQFLSASVIRNIVAQVKSTIDIRQIMDQEKIFIVNLSKGRIGEDSSRLLGGMLITKIQLAAMERVDMPEKDRKDFYLYVDEFQNFAVESFAGILSEARKYRLCLTLAHQYIAQLSDEVREAVFGNVGTLVSFRVGSPDAVFLEKEFEPRFMATDIINLSKYNIYLRLLIDGVASQPFSALTLPPIAQRTGAGEKVIKVTRERYAVPRADIEDKILKWSGVEEGPEGIAKLMAGAAEKKKAAKDAKKPKFEYNCSRCNKLIVLPVELDRSRPIYCEECIEIVREERKTGKKIPLPSKPKESQPVNAGTIVERPPEAPAISLATLAAMAAAAKGGSASGGKESPRIEEDDEEGPEESDVPDVPVADLAAALAASAKGGSASGGKAAPKPPAPSLSVAPATSLPTGRQVPPAKQEENQRGGGRHSDRDRNPRRDDRPRREERPRQEKPSVPSPSVAPATSPPAKQGENQRGGSGTGPATAQGSVRPGESVTFE